MGCSEYLVQLAEEIRLELPALVGDDLLWNSEVLDPAFEESLADRWSGCVGHRYCCGPSGEAVDDGEAVGHSLGRRVWTDYVDVDVAESVVRWDRFDERGVRVSANLRCLAVGAALNKVFDFFVHVWPDEVLCDESSGRFNARVGDVVELLDYASS